MYEVIKDIINYYDNVNRKFDAFCLIVTVPFRRLSNVEKCLKKFSSSNNDLSLFTVRKVPFKYNPNWVYIEKNNRISLFSKNIDAIANRQELPNAYYRDGDIYLFRYNNFKNKKSIYSDENDFIINDYHPYVNIDNLNDWKKAEELIEMYKNEIL